MLTKYRVEAGERAETYANLEQAMVRGGGRVRGACILCQNQINFELRVGLVGKAN